MGNNKINSGENILVKVDQNNLIYIDPNSVVENGEVQTRSVKQEELVMYVNLEADIIPRTILTSSGDKTTLTSIARGTLNFLKPQGGGDYDSSWTNAYNGSDNPVFSKDDEGNQVYEGVQTSKSDGSGQSFGIDSININIKGANFIPQVNINFIDVRGKTLFESPENSPYKAFFHLPWPIFYLTIKGYYGKAIRYRLHLVKFNTKYNESTGNFEVATTFVGSTYAYLNDIPLNGILNAPYMYLIESDKTTTFNQKLGRYEKKVSKSSRGYTMLRSVYDEYKSKNLIPKNFPVKTLREVITVARSLDKILEREIFDQVVDMKLFAGIKEFEKLIQDFESAVRTWGSANLDKEIFVNDGVTYSYLAGQEKTSDKKIVGATTNKTLEQLITNYPKELLKTQLFAQAYLNKTGTDFKKETFSFVNKIGSKGIKSYYKQIEGKYAVALQSLLTDIFDIQASFVAQRDKIETKVEEKMNEVIKDPTKGIGFEPTVRNIFAVVLANADVYIRLLKDVHNKAFEISNSRKKLLSGLSDESIGDNVYPWPEVKKQTANKQKVVVYPGDPDVAQKLQSYNKTLWPEIDFLENYHGIATKRLDPLADKEGSVGNVNFVFESNSQETKTNKISSLFEVGDNIPYLNKSISSLIYEIWERGSYAMTNDCFNNSTIKELALIEFSNIEKMLEEDYDLIDVLNTINSQDKLKEYLLSFSPFERYTYYQDELPTVQYISDAVSTPFKIEQYEGASSKKPDNDNLYKNLSNNLVNHLSETYRSQLYPFNSKLYLSYLNKSKYQVENFGGFLKVDTKEGFISSVINSRMWVQDGYTTDLFAKKLDLDTSDGLFSSTNILNTPYFHKQLFSDFNSTSSYGKYASSAYLLLNSLPFKDLQDELSYSGLENVRMCDLFKEVGASHYIPYHLMLKWGSQYHRYKKYKTENIDILSGVTTPIDIDAIFTGSDYGVGLSSVDVDSDTIFPSDSFNVGIHPVYDAIYHQIINGYNHFDYINDFLGGINSYTGRTSHGDIVHYKTRIGDEINYWTTFTSSSGLTNGNETHFTLLPSVGANNAANIGLISGATLDQASFRILWTDETVYTTFSGKTFPSYGEHHRDTKFNDYLVMDSSIQFKKIFDLIATFSPQILDKFEEYFLDFASERVNVEIPYKKFSKVKYDNFQDLLKGIVTIKRQPTEETNVQLQINSFRTRQLTNLKDVTTSILSDGNLIKLTIANPKEIDLHVWGGFAQLNSDNKFSYNTYDTPQYTTGTTIGGSWEPGTKELLELYLGEEPQSGTTTTYYKDFFELNNIELSEENILQFRPLIYIYAGYRKSLGATIPTRAQFQKYLIDNILSYTTMFNIGVQNRRDLYMNTLISKLVGLKGKTNTLKQTVLNGYNDTPVKLDQYNFFKSFNDKWVAGNSIGQRLLLEEFLFLDKANRDIGDKTYLNLERLIALEEPNNDKQNLYGVISMLLQGTGFDMRALPAYVNFYGTNFSNKTKLTPSKKIAKNLFGTFLEVDYQESSPKIIIQYTGPTSKHLDMKDVNEKYKFNNDSFNVGDPNKNPLVITIPDVFNTGDLSKSNKVVAFEVSFGDQNQSMFKGVSLDQSSIRNTTESFIAQENLGRSESGSAVYQVDIGLFDIYRQASYTCDVSMMGNVMIQPTMYFYLKNIPMFRGSYWITEVSHNIRGNTINTSFKGTRIPYASLPDPKDSFMSSYRALFDRLSKKAIAKVKEQNLSLTGDTKNEKSISTDLGVFTIDMGGKEQQVTGEELIKESGVTEFGVKYNGYNGEKYIQKIKYKGETYFRAVVSVMGGNNYKIEPNIQMSLLSRVTSKTISGTTTTPSLIVWSELEKTDRNFYSVKFDLDVANANKIITATTTFLNPKNNKTATINPISSSTISPSNVQGPINVGPKTNGYGIGISSALAKELGIYDNEVLYFNLK